VACWDIIGKAVGQPVWSLLGGQCHEKIKAYANAWHTVERTPQEFDKRVKVVLDKGYKLPPGPGMGISLNEDLIKEHPQKERFFSMFETDWHMRGFGKQSAG
jgi:L-alanine-DL-glutamate epimerase-like enolase superfamily enzyme